MRNTLLAAAVAFVVGGAAAGSLMTYAQPAPSANPPPTVEPAPPPGPAGWGDHWREGHRPAPFSTFALVYRQRDRNLSTADVQKIAEAFLLWHGNHSWKVIDVAPTSDGTIGFALATQEGSVVARFTMDPHSGRLERVG
jgi:hypothetical protein